MAGFPGGEGCLDRVREAIDAARKLELAVIFVADGCLVGKVFPTQAEVTTVAQWAAAARSPACPGAHGV